MYPLLLEMRGEVYIIAPPKLETWLVRTSSEPSHNRQNDAARVWPETGEADVRLLTIGPTRRAAIRFSGRADDALMQVNETRLRDWLNEKGYATTGPAIYAYYDDPLTPGMFRRNEVLFEVER